MKAAVEVCVVLPAPLCELTGSLSGGLDVVCDLILVIFFFFWWNVIISASNKLFCSPDCFVVKILLAYANLLISECSRKRSIGGRGLLSFG